MIETRSELLETRNPVEGYVWHRYRSPEIAGKAVPGQFVHVRVADGVHPILRRPFSIYDARDETFEILFKVIGEGTELLRDKKPGDLTDILGPIGKGFEMEKKPAILIAGGIGCAPLYFLAKRFKNENIHTAYFYGARTKSDLVMEAEISSVCDEFHTATEDGSTGYQGFVTELARERFIPGVAIYACGPDPMLGALKKILDEKKLKAQLSLENKMACGTGACQGCVVALEGGYQRVCVDGPVFRSERIKRIGDGGKTGKS